VSQTTLTKLLRNVLPGQGCSFHLIFNCTAIFSGEEKTRKGVTESLAVEDMVSIMFVS
jgi:hypothetical protein